MSPRVDGGLLYVPVRLAGEERWALLDTGRNGSSSVPEELWHALPRTPSSVVESVAVSGYTIGGPRTAALERLDGILHIAGHEFPNSWMSLHPADELVVGGGALSGCIVTVELENRLLRCARALRNRQRDETSRAHREPVAATKERSEDMRARTTGRRIVLAAVAGGALGGGTFC